MANENLKKHLILAHDIYIYIYIYIYIFGYIKIASQKKTDLVFWVWMNVVLIVLQKKKTENNFFPVRADVVIG
jgi:hypothetical protein